MLGWDSCDTAVQATHADAGKSNKCTSSPMMDLNHLFGF